MQLLLAEGTASPLAARAVSFPVAATVTWFLNRVWTFANGRARRARSQYLRYVVVQILGFAVNYLVFAGLVLYSPWQISPIVALAAGSIVAMFLTFFASRHFVFSAS